MVKTTRKQLQVLRKTLHKGRIWILGSAISVTIVAVIAAWLLIGLLNTSGSVPPSVSATIETQQLLRAVQQNPKGKVPPGFPGYLLGGTSCWAFFQERMPKNDNQYEIVVTNISDSQTLPNSVHDMIEVWLNINFPDGATAEMYYSQGGLTGCRTLSSP